MKLCIAGNNNIAVDLLYFSFKYFNKNEICVLLNKNDSCKNTWQKSLGFYANYENISILTIKEVEVLKDIIFISTQYDRIVKPELFNSTELFNLHFSYLPEYKGMYPSVIPILDCKNYSGVTLHKIDKGIDTGDIIAQKKISINNLTAELLYDKNLNEGFKLIAKNFNKIINKKYKVKVQSQINSTYISKSRINFNEIQILTNQTAFQISRFVSAFNFWVYQMPTFEGKKIYKTNILKSKSLKRPGEIINSNFEYFIISTIDYNLKLYIDFKDDLIECCKNNNFEYAKKILKYIKKIDFITKEGWTPLMIAAYNGSFEVCKLLIERKANINATNLNGTTVLMYSKDGFLNTNDNRTFKYLILNGANKFSKDIYGKTVFDYCEKKILENL